MPHVRVEPGENREGSRADPNVDESVRIGVWHSWVSSVRVPEILLHFPLALSFSYVYLVVRVNLSTARVLGYPL